MMIQLVADKKSCSAVFCYLSQTCCAGTEVTNLSSLFSSVAVYLIFSLYDSTSPSYPPPLLISRLFSLMPLKATPLRLVALSIEMLPNQIQTQGLWEAPCDLVLQIRRLL